ncbi:MAG: ATP phosphoribosyltransferase regulatory subunit [Deltaproteobacteria bacterium]|nr:ATP phosphoribosyltransferase regulatory subunit [Deltaproteobacteria bacterium]TLN00984.1 MAG: ATP phosphoribosyltransferase regulatory subunit [bacterium]
MTFPRNIEASLPKGVADFLPEKAAKIGSIQERILKVFELWGFRRIITPLLEFQDVMALAIGDDLKERIFRFDDRQTGKLLVIPPDITPQIARIVATRMTGYPLPHRLYYRGRVLRHAELQSGRSREIFQAGVELIGLDSPEADAEMTAIAVEVLKSLGLSDFKIAIGQVEFFRGIMDSADFSPASRVLLRNAIGKKDVSALRELLENEPVADSVKEELLALPRLFGGPEVLEEADRRVTNDRSRKALDNISQVLDVLDIYGVSDFLTIDLGEIRGLDYYTGVTLEGFVGGIGEPVCSGGRYDNLTAHYGFPSPATGFAFNIMALLAAVEKKSDVGAGKAGDFLVFNAKDDRREALEVARRLRKKGFTVARDIIRRALDDSLEYARKMNILHVIVIGAADGADDHVYVVRVADKKGITVAKSDLYKKDFPLSFGPLQGD